MARVSLVAVVQHWIDQQLEIEAVVSTISSATGIFMHVDDILVNGPPWNTRIAVRGHHWVAAPNGEDDYHNRAVLFATTRWGKIINQEDYEDTVRVADFDARQRRGADT